MSTGIVLNTDSFPLLVNILYGLKVEAMDVVAEEHIILIEPRVTPN